MTAVRRVRLTRYVHEQVGRIPRLQRIAIIERPLVVGELGGRTIWGWQVVHGLIANRFTVEVRRDHP